MTGGRPHLLAPLRIEARALRAGAPDAHVAVTGMGAGRAARAAAALEGPVAVGGFGGGLDGRVAPGDVVVATEVRGPTGVRPTAGAELLAATLRRAGLRVHTGPIVSVERAVTGSRRAAVATSGALAADMESFWLLEHHEGPAAVVRAVVDTAGAELWSPSTAGHALRAYRSLRTAAAGLAAWGSAVRPRRVVLAAPRSFCAGVERAIEIVERSLERFGAPVYVRRQIVHNVHVVRRLEGRGAVFVEELDEVPEGATVVLSAHGVAPAVRAEAVDRGLHVIDATCPLVAKVHAEARRFSAQGYGIVLIGHRGHDEIDGTLGEVAGIRLVESPGDADAVEVDDASRVAYLTQTTLSTDEVADTVHRLRRRFPDLIGPAADDICYATQNRQDAVRAVAAECDLLLVVGSANSSNSNRLVEVAEREGTPAHLVDHWTEMDLRWLAGAGTVGVTAGASAPDEMVSGVVDALAELGTVEIVERSVTTESVRFALPAEVR